MAEMVEERKSRYWQKCATAVNAVGGNGRSWKKVRKQWFSLKDKAKKVKGEMGRTGGGPKPYIPQSIHLCMEVMAKESLDGIRGRSSEADPIGTESVEMSQESSQEDIPLQVSSTRDACPSNTQTTTSATFPQCNSVLTDKIHQLESQVESLTSQRSAFPRASEMRQLKLQEELLKLEQTKVDLMRQTLEVQKKMLFVMESKQVQTLLLPMTEQ